VIQMEEGEEDELNRTCWCRGNERTEWTVHTTSLCVVTWWSTRVGVEEGRAALAALMMMMMTVMQVLVLAFKSRLTVVEC
jgi:hypothetical protein